MAQQSLNTIGITHPERDQPASKWDEAEADISEALRMNDPSLGSLASEDLIIHSQFRPRALEPDSPAPVPATAATPNEPPASEPAGSAPSGVGLTAGRRTSWLGWAFPLVVVVAVLVVWRAERRRRLMDPVVAVEEEPRGVDPTPPDQ